MSRRPRDNDNEDAGPLPQRRRAAGRAVAVGPAGADNRGLTRRAQQRAALGDVDGAGEDEAPEVPEAGSGSEGEPSAEEDSNRSGGSGDEEEEEGDSDDGNDRDTEVARQLGLLPPGADDPQEEAGEEEQPGEGEWEGDEYEDEEEEDEGEEEEEEEEEEEDGGYRYAGNLAMPGGADYDIVFVEDENFDEPLRAQGAVPTQQAGDQEITTGVWAREAADSHHMLYGPALANCPKLLSRILKMTQQRGQLLWRSELQLTDREWRYLRDVFAAARIQPLLQQGQRVLTPLPDYGFPERFRLRDRSGRVLAGPKITRSGKPWNVGRQYFSSFTQGDFSSFIWADGVKAMEPEAQASFNEAMMGFW